MTHDPPTSKKISSSRYKRQIDQNETDTEACVIKMAAFHYNYAVMCRVPHSLANRSVGSDQYKNAIDVEKARDEYETIKDVLKSCDFNIVELVEDENYPDSCFVEDTAVAIGNTALLARPGHVSRQGEVSLISARTYTYNRK